MTILFQYYKTLRKKLDLIEFFFLKGKRVRWEGREWSWEELEEEVKMINTC